VLGHCWVDTLHIHTFEVDSLLSKLFALHHHSHAEWLILCQQKQFSFESTGSVKFHRSQQIRLVIFIQIACAPDICRTELFQTVATRVVLATWSFYSARGIGSPPAAGVGGCGCGRRVRSGGRDLLPVEGEWVPSVETCRLYARHFPSCTMFLIKHFGIEMVLCNLYFKRFELTKGLCLTLSSIQCY